MLKNLTPFAHGFVHAVVALLVFGVPLILAQNQQVADLTVSSVVTLALHWLENKYGN